MIWYELWDVTIDMLLDEGDDPAYILEGIQELMAESEMVEEIEMLLVERHPALNAESFINYPDVIPHLEKRVAAREQRHQR